MRLGLCLLRPWLFRWAREGLAGELPVPAVESLLDEAMIAAHRGTSPSRSGREATSGGELMVAFAGLTVELSEGLLRCGLGPASARRLTARVTWAVHRRMAKVPWWIARLTPRRSEVRLRRATGPSAASPSVYLPTG